ncbi:hypothetical protein H4R33_005834 [Dimargaris cristalligena]|nr:hypothetical protein H4R33_005834 [Dimargaris cristalligena]
MKVIAAAASLFLLAASAAALTDEQMACLGESVCDRKGQTCLAGCFGMSDDVYKKTQSCFLKCSSSTDDCSKKCNQDMEDTMGATIDEIDVAWDDVHSGKSSNKGANASTASTAATKTNSDGTTPSADESDDSSSAAAAGSAGVVTGSLAVAALLASRYMA